MKKITLIALMLFTAFSYAQVGINTNTPDASSALEIESSTGGILIPRLTETQRDAISAPATGLMIYQTNGTSGFYFYDGNIWTKVDGVAGAAGPTGPQGVDGLPGVDGTNGTDGADGSGGGTSYNNEISFQAAQDGSNYELHLTSTGNVYSGISWSRSSTTITITSPAHGLSTGDYVVLRNMSSDYTYVSITSTGTNTFTATVGDSGDTSGNEGAYIPAPKATVTNSSGDVTAISITAPSVGNIRVNAIQLYANEQLSNLTLTVPSSLNNGNGFSDKQQIIPVVGSGIGVSGTGTSGGITPAFRYNLGTNINRINVTGIDNGTPIILSVKL